MLQVVELRHIRLASLLCLEAVEGLQVFPHLPCGGHQGFYGRQLWQTIGEVALGVGALKAHRIMSYSRVSYTIEWKDQIQIFLCVSRVVIDTSPTYL